MDKKIEPRGVRNCNPLNIRPGSPWKGLRKVQTDKGFCQFESMAYGWRAGLILIRNYIQGRVSSKKKYDTIAAIIFRWASPLENNTQAYIDSVSHQTGIHWLEKISWHDRAKVCAIVQAMARVECGRTFPIEDIQSAYDLLT